MTQESEDEKIDRLFKELGTRVYAVECMIVGLCLRLASTLSEDPKAEVEKLRNNAHHIMNQFNLLPNLYDSEFHGIAEARLHLHDRLTQVKSNMDAFLSQPAPQTRHTP